MLLWRIAREIKGDTTLEGIGGLLVAGRWYRRGHPIRFDAKRRLHRVGTVACAQPDRPGRMPPPSTD